MKQYFTVFLPKQRNASQHTITACKDTWNLFFRFLSKEKGAQLKTLGFADIGTDVVVDFLDTSERERHWKPATRNQRLSCIRSFLYYAASMEPTLYAYAVELDGIPLKKGVDNSRVMEFISQDGIRELLVIPDIQTRIGQRDQFFMALMYDIAARNSAMLGMKYEDFCAGNNTVYLWGKGSKPRLVPVSKETTALFEQYRRTFHSNSRKSDSLFYTIHRHEKTTMSSDNVARFLKRYVSEARKKNEEIPERVYPHMIRRPRAMHLYRSGMPLALLAEFLGHEDPETTLIYTFADTEMKREAIEKIKGNISTFPNCVEKGFWEGDDDIIAQLCNGC